MNQHLFATGLRAARITAAAAIGAVLVGCASVKLPAPTATADTVQKLRTANLQPAKPGTFALAPGKNPDMDRSQGGLRGSSVAAESGSFAQYLKDVIAVELKAAGLYDEAAKTMIDAQLLDSQLDAAIGTGTGRLAARFTVTRDGKTLYDKQLSVDGKWESSFVGAVALPAAINEYGQFYKRLAAKLFEDAEFRAALAK
jgi:hypothetical protein